MAQIRWKQSDYITLGRAVSDFNKKIKAIESEENKLYLPEKQNYQNLKNTIQTRKELNRVINDLKRFKQKGQEDLYVTLAGEKMTTWERETLKSQEKIAISELKKSAKVLEKPISSGYSKAQMGSIEYQKILANLRSIRNLEQKQGKEFGSIKERIKKFGNYDYTYIKATIYRENWMKALKESGAENFENYDVLMRKLKRIKNPLNFFKLIQKSDIMSDIFLYYKPRQRYSLYARICK